MALQSLQQWFRRVLYLIHGGEIPAASSLAHELLPSKAVVQCNISVNELTEP